MNILEFTDGRKPCLRHHCQNSAAFYYPDAVHTAFGIHSKNALRKAAKAPKKLRKPLLIEVQSVNYKIRTFLFENSSGIGKINKRTVITKNYRWAFNRFNTLGYLKLKLSKNENSEYKIRQIEFSRRVLLDVSF